ncbi:unnamed protein product [Polarella glacialis]|uniref:EF-hand domain-containing protein n=1 Tax=Polarella glacialis TaxID=89957 RepID=A0A813HED9_POLGL|nr:unnamed protein product [Polarella glacialis]
MDPVWPNEMKFDDSPQPEESCIDRLKQSLIREMERQFHLQELMILHNFKKLQENMLPKTYLPDSGMSEKGVFGEQRSAPCVEKLHDHEAKAKLQSADAGVPDLFDFGSESPRRGVQARRLSLGKGQVIAGSATLGSGGSLSTISLRLKDVVHGASAGGLRPSYQRTFAVKILAWHDWWSEVKEPERTGCIAAFVKSKTFEMLCATVIILNAAFAVYTANVEINNLFADPTPFVIYTEIIFTAYYIIELLLKLAVHRVFFFCNMDMQWNLFDMGLVLLAVYDMTLVFVLAGSRTGTNMTFMRTFRVLKIAKVFRIVRVLRFFTELRLMMRSVAGSFMSLFWSFVLLALIFYVFGLLFVNGAVRFLQDYLLKDPSAVDDPTMENMLLLFGSVQKAMLSLFMATTSGCDWQDLYRNMIEDMDWLTAAMFLFFIGFMHVALLNVLTGLFVESALKLAEPERDAKALQKRKTDKLEWEELVALSREIDLDNSGYINTEELITILQDDVMKSRFAVLGLDVRDADIFFGMLNTIHGTDQIEIEAFAAGCMRLKGSASSLDLQCLFYETRMIQRNHGIRMDSMLVKLDELSRDLREAKETKPTLCGLKRVKAESPANMTQNLSPGSRSSSLSM